VASISSDGLVGLGDGSGPCDGLLRHKWRCRGDCRRGFGARLYRSVKVNDLAQARRLNDRIYPTARVFYADPFVDMHNRMKEALVLLRKLPPAMVRPPLVKITDAEIARIQDKLMKAELLGTRTALGRSAA
jgi:4-hydroxy-tetrahydrodipicolinate synthase